MPNKVTLAFFSGPQHVLRSVSGELFKGDEGSETQHLGDRPVCLFPVSRNTVLLRYFFILSVRKKVQYEGEFEGNYSSFWALL
jgi:hypothetical protein